MNSDVIVLLGLSYRWCRPVLWGCYEDTWILQIRLNLQLNVNKYIFLCVHPMKCLKSKELSVFVIRLVFSHCSTKEREVCAKVNLAHRESESQLMTNLQIPPTVSKSALAQTVFAVGYEHHLTIQQVLSYISKSLALHQPQPLTHYIRSLLVWCTTDSPSESRTDWLKLNLNEDERK